MTLGDIPSDISTPEAAIAYANAQREKADRQKGIDRAANQKAMEAARARQIADRDSGDNNNNNNDGPSNEGGQADSGSGGGQVGSENEDGDGFDGNKGGLVSQMKRSGLASKK